MAQLRPPDFSFSKWDPNERVLRVAVGYAPQAGPSPRLEPYETHPAPQPQQIPGSSLITFDANGGTPTPGNIRILPNEPIGNLPSVSRAGHSFRGWWTARTGGTLITNATVPSANSTYIARWRTNAPAITFPQSNAEVPHGDVVVRWVLLPGASYIIQVTESDSERTIIPNRNLSVVISSFTIERSLLTVDRGVNVSVTAVTPNAESSEARVRFRVVDAPLVRPPGSNVRTYSLQRHRNDVIFINGFATDFTVGQFACRSGADEVLICDLLVYYLQVIGDHFGFPVFISSGYRTAENEILHRRSVDSQHVHGRAADFWLGRDRLEVPHSRVWNFVRDELGFGVTHGGLGTGGTFTHIDTRTGPARWTY